MLLKIILFSNDSLTQPDDDSTIFLLSNEQFYQHLKSQKNYLTYMFLNSKDCKYISKMKHMFILYFVRISILISNLCLYSFL